MTTQNWPDPTRPGVPLFPERDGWHALDTGQFIHVWHWYAKQKWWERRPNTDIAHEPKHFQHFLYIGPALTPTQINEMLAGERERCAKTCEAEQIPDFSMPEQWHNNGCKHSARAIRNLGDAP